MPVKNSSVVKNIPAMANVNGSIRPSNANIVNIHSDGRMSPVLVEQTTVLGTISQYSKKHYSKDSKDESVNTTDKDNDFNPGGNNPQSIDTAFLDQDVDTIGIIGSIKFISECMSLTNCQLKKKSTYEIGEFTTAFMSLFKDKGGFELLGKAYASRLAGGHFAFRNRWVLDAEVAITIENENLTFSCQASDFGNSSAFDFLSQRIGSALCDKSQLLTLNYRFSGQSNLGSEVYPSQELNQKSDKELFKRHFMNASNAAAIHSQKIGNAIRSIDVWYKDYDQLKASLPVDPYGPHKATASARRRPGSGESFYELFTAVDQLIEQLQTGDVNGDCLYFAAMLVRGGVFSGGDEKK